jgi:hypothetical protein
VSKPSYVFQHDGRLLDVPWVPRWRIVFFSSVRPSVRHRIHREVARPWLLQHLFPFSFISRICEDIVEHHMRRGFEGTKHAVEMAKAWSSAKR